MYRGLWFFTAAIIVAASPFVGMASGRAFYHALIWFSHLLGFTPNADVWLQAESFGGFFFGFFISALCIVCAGLCIDRGFKAARP